jgi:hypothetical protein
MNSTRFVQQLGRYALRSAILDGLGLCLAAQLLSLAANVAPLEQHFTTPEQAVNALMSAAKARDTNAMHAIFGPAAVDLVSPAAFDPDRSWKVVSD